MTRTSAITSTVLLAAGLTAGTYYSMRPAAPTAEVRTQPVDRGDIVDSIGATGTLEAVTTVQVGTQVSGTVQELYADFNSRVRKGQVIAKLEPSLLQTQVAQERANLTRAEADRERLSVAVDDAETKLRRARELSARQLIPATELDTAEVNLRSSQAQLRSADAQVTQARASLNQTDVNLQKTVITAPIDGIVIARNVDVGQTVAASLQAPTLYVIAADLSKMRVSASIDESDVGRVRPGQRVTFRVDAFPSDEFIGTVSQVRLNPVTVQNVVTYATVIDVPNPELKLKPGMTATVTVEAARRSDVLRIANAALRFNPTTEIFAALGQAAPASNEQRARGTGAGVTTAATRDRGSVAPVSNNKGTPVSPAAKGTTGVKPNDALFAPLTQAETTGRVWTQVDGRLQPVRVRLGLSDGAYTELVSGDLEEGSTIVTAVNMGTAAASTPAAPNPAAGNPLMGPQRGPGQGGGRRR